MKRNNGYLEIEFNYNYQDMSDKGIICSLNRIKNSFYLNTYKLFFKEDDNIYHELIGSKICEYLNIDSVKYDMAIVKFRDVSFKGVISLDFRIDNYEIINFDKIFLMYMKENRDYVDNYMNLEFIEKVFNYRYKNYLNKDIIVNNLMDRMKEYFLLDILIGNNDNGKYNYEIMENDNDSVTCPYFDFGNIFNFGKTRFTYNDGFDNDAYANLSLFLENSDRIWKDKFISMYEMLTPDKLEEIIASIEDNKGIKISDNFKNILFLSYSRHYEKIGNIIINYRIDSSFYR